MAQAESDHSISKCDPVIGAGREIKRLKSRIDDLRELPEGVSTEAVYRAHEIDDLEDRVEILRAYITVVPSQSLGGALVQIEELGNLIDLSDNSRGLDWQIKSDALKKDRLVNSIKDALKRAVPDALAQSLHDGNAHLNPFIPYEQRVAVVMRRRAA